MSFWSERLKVLPDLRKSSLHLRKCRMKSELKNSSKVISSKVISGSWGGRNLRVFRGLYIEIIAWVLGKLKPGVVLGKIGAIDFWGFERNDGKLACYATFFKGSEILECLVSGVTAWNQGNEGWIYSILNCRSDCFWVFWIILNNIVLTMQYATDTANNAMRLPSYNHIMARVAIKMMPKHPLVMKQEMSREREDFVDETASCVLGSAVLSSSEVWVVLEDFMISFLWESDEDWKWIFQCCFWG